MRLPKIVIFLLSVTLIKLVTGCFFFDCHCPEPTIVEMNFNQSTIKTIDNTSEYILNYPSKSDTMAAKAVAFFIELTDTLNPEYNYEWAKSKVHQPIVSVFNSAMALAPCLCNKVDFLPKGKLKSISISTSFDLNSTISAGEDITHLFVGRFDNSVPDGSNLYCSIGDIMEYQHNVEIYDKPTISFSIYLQETVQNDSLQFDICFNFDDNTCINNTSSTIYLTHNQQ